MLNFIFCLVRNWVATPCWVHQWDYNRKPFNFQLTPYFAVPLSPKLVKFWDEFLHWWFFVDFAYGLSKEIRFRIFQNTYFKELKNNTRVWLFFMCKWSSLILHMKQLLCFSSFRSRLPKILGRHLKFFLKLYLYSICKILCHSKTFFCTSSVMIHSLARLR